MTLLNQVGVETPWGYRAVELYHGDLMALGEHVDVLVFSCFRGSYYPSPGTVVKALYGAGVDVESCARTPALDLRSPFGTWLSGPVPGGRFGRILCSEIRPLTWDKSPTAGSSTAFDDVFVTLSAYEARGGKASCVAMPALGAGLQKLDPVDVAESLVRAAPAYLRRSATTERILFVEIDEVRAEALGAAIDAALHRADVSLPRSSFVQSVQQEIRDALPALRDVDRRLHADLEAVLSRDHVRSFELGVIGRRVAERVVRDVSGTPSRDLASGIEGLAAVGGASWIRSYLHVLRVLGNESAHEQGGVGRRPANVEARDVEIGLFCLQRLIAFWIDNRPG